MSASRDADDDHRSDPPLWSMGLAVLVILAAPLILYSLAPAGPLRAGDTIFSQGQQRVLIASPVTTSGPQARHTCLLDPNNPLIILELPHEHLGGDILATVQGNPAAERPFCPLHAQVLINTHQMLQKPDLWGAPMRALAGLFQG
jgi:hypothetical protein